MKTPTSRGPGQPQPPPGEGGGAAGFDILNGMIREQFQAGKSPSLERVVGAGKAAAAQYAAANPSPKAKEDAETVARAFDLASELVVDLAAGARKAREK